MNLVTGVVLPMRLWNYEDHLFPSTDVFERALNAGFIQATDYVNIWEAYLDYLRRRVDFSKGESTLTLGNAK